MQDNLILNIIHELENASQKIDVQDLENMVDMIVEAKTIFISGAGRSGYVARGFSNRLNHLGFKVHFVGEPTTPPIKKDDLLIVISGSGKTESLVLGAQKAKSLGAKVTTLTIEPQNTIGKLTDAFIKIPGSTRLIHDNKQVPSIQPVGTIFEQLSWIVCDTLVLMLCERTNQSFEDLLLRHANIE